MKRIIVIVLFVLVLFGCGRQVEPVNSDKKVTKIDSSENYIYYEDYQELDIAGSQYKLRIPIINVDNDDIKKVNSDIRKFIVDSYNDYKIDNNSFINGNYIDINHYENDKYISLIIKYNRYDSNEYDEDNYIVYNIEIENGRVLDNECLLRKFKINDLESIVRKKLDSDDIEYSIMSMKNNYYLYVDNDVKLHVLFYEVSDNEQFKRDLILN